MPPWWAKRICQCQVGPIRPSQAQQTPEARYYTGGKCKVQRAPRAERLLHGRGQARRVNLPGTGRAQRKSLKGFAAFLQSLCGYA
jgi:hypothetical protein